MSVRYDLYQPSDSWLHRLDPRVKLLFVASISAILLMSRNVWVMLAALAAVHAALWSAGIAGRRIAWVWRVTLPTMVLIAVLWVVLNPGEGPALLAVWFLRVTVETIAEGLALALRIGALAFAVFTWLFTTDQATLVRGLVSLGMSHSWGLILAMALRYLPTMAGTFRVVSDAQQARALDLTRGNLVARARAYLPIVVAMLITALRTAENLSRALESRALGAGVRRTYYRQLHYRRVDAAWTVAIVVALGLFLWARIAWGVGAAPLQLVP
ncbi:MAG TPA: energy-coupling factor transporter transmembrane protein EcfT [Chloroflexi bacterium]|jgi:energy-coupling factor transport system permease protein|nr:energy-coupling factor transporter transmembrane protein EcfT [Chloroflexota bacterium]